jgi:serine/threonine-protein kinase
MSQYPQSSESEPIERQPASERALPTAPAENSNPRIGRYEILERIAVGGMAEAFRARAHGPGGYQRELVIKRILPHLAQDPDFVRAFVDEAKILGMLNHPNIVGVYDFGEDQGRLYLALEFLDGPSLATLSDRATTHQQPIPTGIVAYLGKEICQGLSAVHTARDPQGNPLGLIHRDVTPSNIITTTAGGVKLLDFGVAKIASSDQVTQHGRLKGKPGYFAPEQIAGTEIDARLDLFSLGVLLYEMTCLRHLFHRDGEGIAATIYRILQMEIPGPMAIRPETPPELDRIIMKALSREREDRFASAAEMARELDAVVMESGTRAEDLARFVATQPTGAAATSPSSQITTFGEPR